MIDTHGAQVVVCTDSGVCTLTWTATWLCWLHSGSRYG